MKRFIIVIVVSLFSTYSYSQVSDRFSPDQNPISNWDHFNIDYTIKNVSSLDVNLVNAIDFSKLEELRLLEEDIEVFDVPSGYTIVLFSVKKTGERKSLYHQNQPVKSDENEH